jgi:hypothetical protein
LDFASGTGGAFCRLLYRPHVASRISRPPHALRVPYAPTCRVVTVLLHNVRYMQFGVCRHHGLSPTALTPGESTPRSRLGLGYEDTPPTDIPLTFSPLFMPLSDRCRTSSDNGSHPAIFLRSSRLEVSLGSLRGSPEGWCLGHGQSKVTSRNLHRYRHASFPCGSEAAYRFMVELGLPAPLSAWVDAFVAAHVRGMGDWPQKHTR